MKTQKLWEKKNWVTLKYGIKEYCSFNLLLTLISVILLWNTLIFYVYVFQKTFPKYQGLPGDHIEARDIIDFRRKNNIIVLSSVWSKKFPVFWILFFFNVGVTCFNIFLMNSEWYQFAWQKVKTSARRGHCSLLYYVHSVS